MTQTDEIMAVLEQYPKNQRYALAAMQDMQRRFRYLPREGLLLLSQHLDCHFSQLYAMATFYKAFSLTPKGRHVIRLCDGTACHIRGGNKLLESVERLLGVSPGQTTPDGLFTLELVNCLGSCAIAPVLLIDETFYGRLTPDKLPAIFASYRREVDL